MPTLSYSINQYREIVRSYDYNGFVGGITPVGPLRTTITFSNEVIINHHRLSGRSIWSYELPVSQTIQGPGKYHGLSTAFGYVDTISGENILDLLPHLPKDVQETILYDLDVFRGF